MGSRRPRRRGGQREAPPDAATWYALVVTGVFAGALGYLVGDLGAVRGPRPRARAVFTLEAPFAAALRACCSLPEHLGWAGWTGCADADARSPSPNLRPRDAPAARPSAAARRWTPSSWRLVSAALLRGDAGGRSASRSARRSSPPPSVHSSCRSRRSPCSASPPCVQGGVTLLGPRALPRGGRDRAGTVQRLHHRGDLARAGPRGRRSRSGRHRSSRSRSPCWRSTSGPVPQCSSARCSSWAAESPSRSKQERPRHVRRLGIASALLGAALLALPRQPRCGTSPSDTGRPVDDGSAPLMLAASLLVTSSLIAARAASASSGRAGRRALAAPGDVRRLSYVRALRGRSTAAPCPVVALIVATESLFGVAFSAVVPRPVGGGDPPRRRGRTSSSQVRC